MFGIRDALTLALVKSASMKRGCCFDTLREVIPGGGGWWGRGPVRDEFISVTHTHGGLRGAGDSQTPLGVVIHTGDFKIDRRRGGARPLICTRFARYGNEGVLACFSDSTNVDRPALRRRRRAIVPRH